jgi:hypothetical protein
MNGGNNTLTQNQDFLFLFPMDDNAISGCIIKCEQLKVTVFGKIPEVCVTGTTKSVLGSNALHVTSLL